LLRIRRRASSAGSSGVPVPAISAVSIARADTQDVGGDTGELDVIRLAIAQDMVGDEDAVRDGDNSLPASCCGRTSRPCVDEADELPDGLADAVRALGLGPFGASGEQKPPSSPPNRMSVASQSTS
jgi:hypothetical protein